MIENTYIYNPVRPDFIHKCLDSLYKNTDMSHSRVIVVDQTLDGLQLSREQVHLVLRPYRNLGFSKSMNEGIIHALRWGSYFITCANDDIEYIDPRWWDGILSTFEKYGDRTVAVNPMCPREPGWGYGLEHGKYLDLLPYKEFTSEDYDYLLKGEFKDARDGFNHLFEEAGRKNTFPEQKSGAIDAIATWHTTFKRDFFTRVGLFEERYYPGGGEDYDLNARAYKQDLRMLGSTLSWVWHWWGSSKDVVGDYKGKSLPIVQDLRWMNPHQLWPEDKNGGQSMDPWGKWTDKEGKKHPMYREEEIGIIEI